ncbi:MAG TPA: peptide deformylase [Candidatus Cloacimonadota bacterium]|nr:peptide deformylase [Candidatus Cloacimonadota bacterium]
MKKEPTLLPIRILGDDILRQKAAEVAEIDPEIKDFAQDLTYTMYLKDGVGLAAPQVGKSIRMFVIDPGRRDNDKAQNPIVIINPVIEEKSGESVSDEGCISVPDVFAEVKRFEKLKISYTDLEGKRHTEEVSGFVATVIQHENDHLDGVLFIDRISALAKLKNSAKIRQILSKAVDGVNILSKEK